jgi:FkbM family methyltransferase
MKPMIAQTKRHVYMMLPPGIRFMRNGRWFLKNGEPEARHLTPLVEPGTAVVDIGANIGWYSYVLCQLAGKRGRVIAVEPVAENARFLRAAARQLRLPMDVLECALSSRNGEENFYVPIHDGKPETQRARLAAPREGAETRRVLLRRLDDLASEIGRRVSFLKIDAEGHEFEILKGGEETLATHRPNLLVEIEQRHHTNSIAEIFAFLEGHGYRGRFLDAAERWRCLTEFDVWRHQTSKLDDVSSPDYVNNFVFEPFERATKLRKTT